MSLIPPLNLNFGPSPSNATSGIVDTAPISNEGFTGAFNVGSGSAGQSVTQPMSGGAGTQAPSNLQPASYVPQPPSIGTPYPGQPVAPSPYTYGSAVGASLTSSPIVLAAMVLVAVLVLKRK
jgi:hypothetical protein